MSAPFPPTYDNSIGEESIPQPPRFPVRRLAPFIVPLVLVPLSLLLLTTLGGEAGAPDMSGFFDFIKSLLLPFLLAALLYALITLLLLPLYRRHRNKYSQYLPLSSPSLPTYTSASTTGGGPLQRPLHIAFNIFTITVDTINTLLPERWKSRKQTVVSASDGFDEEGFGEEMGGDGANGGGYTSEGDDVHIAGVTDAHGIGSGRRRDGLSLSMDAMNALRNGDGRGASRGRGWGSGRNGDRDDSGRRLSRELEEGFADSSDEDEEEDVRREERTPSQRRGVR